MDQSFSLLSAFLETSTDLALVSILTLIFTLYTLYFGKKRIISFILSIFPAYIIYSLIPSKEIFVVLGDSAFQRELNLFLFFVIVAMICHTAIRRIIKSDFSYNHRRKITQAIFLSLIAVLLFLSAIHQTSGLTEIYEFTSASSVYIKSAVFLPLWTFVSLAIVFWFTR